jgi:catechol 2,3-dioxygenase-like lactoylglutathione lyase family enzyme
LEKFVITGLSHTNIRLRDIDRCLPFYVDVLGLKITWEELGQHTGGQIPLARRAVFLRWADGPCQSFVVLQSYPLSAGDDEGNATFQEKLRAMGLNHFGFWVDDLDAIEARAARAGVTMVRDARVTCVGRHYGYDTDSDEPYVVTLQLADPENNVIQLDQWVKVR